MRIIAGIIFVMVAAFVVLFLGGLASAALEIRREKRAGLVPTRPAWEARAKRRAVGPIPLRERLRAFWVSVRYPALELCWCQRGGLDNFPALGGLAPGLGCSAWEAGDPVAIRRHDEAGGYQRGPVAA